MRISTWVGAGIALLLPGITAFSQQLKLGKNPYTVQKSAVLELNSDNQGLLLVRISDTTLINSLAPPDGMIIFFIPTKQLLVRSNGYWQTLVVGSAISSLNGLTGSVQTYAAGATGTDFTISSSGTVHTFNLPSASATARGVITTGAQTIAGAKTFSSAPLFSSFTSGSIPYIGAGGLLSQNNTKLFWDATNSRLGVGTKTFNATYPEKFIVDAGVTTSVNAIVGKGNINNYLQLNIQNQSAGANASSDVVATADNGTETTNYVDMGINSSINSSGVMGAANDAYLYNMGQNFLVGTGSAAKSLIFMTGGTTQSSNERMRIDGNGNVGIGTASPATALHVVGTDPLTLVGVQDGTSTSADSLLTITSGLVRKLPVSAFAAPITSGSLSETGSGILTITGGTDAVLGSGTTIQVKQAGASQNGFLSSTDWNTFNNKASAAIGSLNGLTGNTQTFAVGTGGTDFNIVSSGTTHTFNIPNASATARGVISTGAQTLAGAKTFSSAPLFSSLTAGSVPFIGTGGLLSQDNASFFWDATNDRLGVGTNAPASDFTLSQGNGASTSRGFRFTGNAPTGANTGTGFSVALGYNVAGNKQLWLGDADYLGNITGTFVRYSSSAGITSFDAVAGDNSVRRPIGIGVGGDPLSAVILGGDNNSTAPGSYVWANGNMAIGSSNRSSSAPANGLIVQGNTGIGTSSFNATYPEKLLVDVGSSGSVNAIVGKGNLNSYLQLNIQNQAAGSNASSDVVATADNGSETTNYIDMGINSSINSSGSMGGANDSYLYNIGQNLLIGTGTAAKSLVFMTGGTTQGTNERMRIDGNGVMGIATNLPNSSTKLDVNGGVKLGAKGTAEKNIISFVVSFASNTTVPGASMNILASSYSPGALDYSATIPAGNTPTTTQGSVSVSPDQDLPSNVSIAWSRVSATSTVKVHFINGGTGNQTIPSGLKLYITITEF